MSQLWDYRYIVLTTRTQKVYSRFDPSLFQISTNTILSVSVHEISSHEINSHDYINDRAKHLMLIKVEVYQ